jgi:predicted O-methyltransferase YrrM
MSLNDYLNLHNISGFEGNCDNIPQQQYTLKRLISDFNIKNILEIGFNAGHSADLFLSNSLSNVTSFDINDHNSVKCGKEYIDKKFPSRHTLIIGDSTKTIPEYIINNNSKTFDLIFIDGGHTYEIAMADLLNCKKLAHKDTIVIMDDTVFDLSASASWTIGPSKVWGESIINKTINHIDKEFYCIGRGMSWGKYIL